MCMNLIARLSKRSGGSCELCESTNTSEVYEVPPHSQQKDEDTLLVCGTCHSQLSNKTPLDKEHWKCLLNSMWSEVPAVQVVSWRMLHRLRNEIWANDALDMLYLDDETLAWAKKTADHENTTEAEFHKDSNGTLLQHGDSVVLTKSLDVKGSTLTAKLGTMVKNIRLVEDNVEQIEGKIEGQTIVILTKFVRKA